MDELKIGEKKRGRGRPKGSLDKSTLKAREAIAKLVDGNAHRLGGWLDKIAADDKQGPTVAWRCMMDVLEYHIPKLARTELTGEGGGPVRMVASSTDVSL